MEGNADHVAARLQGHTKLFLAVREDSQNYQSVQQEGCDRGCLCGQADEALGGLPRLPHRVRLPRDIVESKSTIHSYRRFQVDCKSEVLLMQPYRYDKEMGDTGFDWEWKTGAEFLENRKLLRWVE